jgi:hypothetical protein
VRQMTMLCVVPSLGLAVLLGQPTAASHPRGKPSGDDALSASAVAAFLSRVEEPLTSYRARRRLEATNTRFKKTGWVEALTTLENGRFEYRILGEGGSSAVRGRVLHKALDAEARAIAKGDTARAALTHANYEFLDATPLPEGLVRLGVKPRRKDILLVNGALLVTADGADLVEVQGVLAKSPSFWTTRVEVRRVYGRIASVRVPLLVESVANVRIAGRSAFRMTYEYEQVNGRAVERTN